MGLLDTIDDESSIVVYTCIAAFKVTDTVTKDVEIVNVSTVNTPLLQHPLFLYSFVASYVCCP